MAQVPSQVKQLVTRAPRRSSSSTLEVLNVGQTLGRQDSNLTMSATWQNNLDGEEVMINEAATPSSNESDSSKSFEEESLASDLYETDSFDSESENEIERKIISLGHNITAEVPTEWTGKPCRLVPWSPADRSDKFHTISFGNMESLVGDIYETDNGTALEVLPFGAIVKIPVQLKTGRLAPEVSCSFIAKIKDGNCWKDVSADYKGGYVYVLVERMEGVTVAARLTPECGIVKPEGYLFVSDKDVRVKVEFPAGAVENDTEFQFLLETVDPERLAEYKRYSPKAFSSILGFTTTLCVKHEMDHYFRNDVLVELPIDGKYHEGDTDVLFLRWTGEDVEVLDNIPIDKGNGIYAIAIDHFSDYSSIRVRHGSEAQIIAEEAKYASGRINLCTLLTFITFEHVRNSATIRVDCVLAPRAEEVVEKHKKEGLQEIKSSRCRDLPVANHEKIRLDFAGNLTFAPGIPKDHYNLTFLTAAKSNCITFPAFLRLSIGTYFSIINFRNEGKNWVHSIHFDLNLGTKNLGNLNCNPTLVRSREITFAETPTTHFQNEPRPVYLPGKMKPNETEYQTEKKLAPGKIGDRPKTPRYRHSSWNTATKLTNISQSNTDGALKNVRVKTEDVNIGRIFKTLSTPKTPDRVRTNLKCDRLTYLTRRGDNLEDFETTRGSHDQSKTLSTDSVDQGIEFTGSQTQKTGHPVLNEKSLGALVDRGLPWVECQKVARELGIFQDQMERIYEEATRKQLDPSLKVMFYWLSVNRNRKDCDLVSDLVAAFREIGRNDVAEVILTAAKEKRRLWRRDFVP